MYLSKKIKFIYLPFLLSAIALCSLYTFLHWLLIIRFDLFSVKQFVVNFGIPIALPAIPIFFYLGTRLRLLKLLTKKEKDWSNFYYIVLWLILLPPTMIAQSYIETASGKLTELNSMAQIKTVPVTKYYTIKDLHIQKSAIGAHSAFEASGKHNEDLDMHLYVTVPIYNNAADTITPYAWVGLSYNQTISNRLDDKEKDEKYQIFTDDCQRDFDSLKLDQFTYLERVPDSDEGDGLLEASKQSFKYAANTNLPILLARHDSFADRNGNKFEWIFISFGIGAVIWLILILIPPINVQELERRESGVVSSKNDLNEYLDFVKIKEGFVITPILIYLNVGIFLAMFFCGLGFISFKSKDLLTWGANYGPMTMQGDWWRLLTSTFLHGGFMHVAANMYGLIFVGIFLEPVLGKLKYLVIYLITGIVASCASLWWNDAVVSVGASGAIFGLYGVFLALLVTKIFPKEMGTGFMVSTLFFIGYNLLMGAIGNGIDNAAHIGGLVSGFFIGLLLYPSLKDKVMFDEFSDDEEMQEDDENVT